MGLCRIRVEVTAKAGAMNSLVLRGKIRSRVDRDETVWYFRLSIDNERQFTLKEEWS
jgi:hypothetical protein